jgi:RNA polymerase sigma factor for flagellar operon FliA
MTDYADSYASTEYAGAAIHAAMSAQDEQRHLVAYAPLVKRIARQLNSQVSGSMGREDMEQIGLMGLLEALRRYGTPDAGFARTATRCATPCAPSPASWAASRTTRKPRKRSA